MTYRNLIKIVENDGWRYDHQTGSHKVYTHRPSPASSSSRPAES